MLLFDVDVASVVVAAVADAVTVDLEFAVGFGDVAGTVDAVLLMRLQVMARVWSVFVLLLLLLMLL